MASKMVAKVRFDDGTKKSSATGKGADYEIGESYMGDAKQEAAARKQGLVCPAVELQVQKDVIADKDTMIAKLQDENRDLKKALDAAEAKIAELTPQS